MTHCMYSLLKEMELNSAEMVVKQIVMTCVYDVNAPLCDFPSKYTGCYAKKSM